MTLRIVPHLRENGEIEIWAGTLDPSDAQGGPIKVQLGREVSLELNPLATVFDGLSSPLTSRTRIPNLPPGRDYEIFTRIGAQLAQRSGRLTTLPQNLSDRRNPLRILLASCYSILADNARSALPLLRHLESKASTRPHFKIWCGDQVYLDSPASHYFLHTHSREELIERHLAHYSASWFADDGIGESFQYGTNLFTSDDHELWNNAPFATPIAKDTRYEKNRETWREIARHLYTEFQCPAPNPVRFSIDPLTFCVADTRMDRDDSSINFMLPESLNSVRSWIESRSGPGVLVLGQPLFSNAASWLGRKLGDSLIQNFNQFDRLLEALARAERSVLVLSGDVHYSRVATLNMKPGVVVAEAISSPIAQIKGAPGKWKKAPERLKSRKGGALPGSVNTTPDINTAKEGVALIEFFIEIGRAHV